MIAALISIQATGLPGGVGTVLFVLVILSALVACLFGYVLFRLVLVVVALIGGALLGTAIASWLRGEPSGLDYFVACFTCAVIFALLAWFFYRVAFAVCSAAGVAASIVVGALGGAESGGAWVFGGVVGLAVGIYAFIYTRPAFIFLSSVFGAFMAVFATAGLIAGPIEDPQAAVQDLLAQRWVAVMLSLISAALAGISIYVQGMLSRSVRLVLMPQDQPPVGGMSTRVQKRSRGGTQVRPRFTRL